MFLCALYFQSCHSIGIDYTLKEGKLNIEEFEFQNNGTSRYNVKKKYILGHEKNLIVQKMLEHKHKMDFIYSI